MASECGGGSDTTNAAPPSRSLGRAGDRPVVLDDDLLDDREAEAGALRLRREVRVEHALARRLRHAGPVVLHDEVDALVLALARARPRARGPRPAFAGRASRMACTALRTRFTSTRRSICLSMATGISSSGHLPAHLARRGATSTSSAPVLASSAPRCPSCSEHSRRNSRRLASFSSACGRRAKLEKLPTRRRSVPTSSSTISSVVSSSARKRGSSPRVLAVALLHGELDGRERVLDLVREPLRHLLPRADALQVLDARARLLHLAEHAVEDARQLGQLVGARHRHAHVEVALRRRGRWRPTSRLMRRVTPRARKKPSAHGQRPP